MAIRILSSEYTTSIGIARQIPEDLRDEIVFVGRSNSGKSSLLNALCGRKNLARVGATPGKTRTINLYEVDYRGADEERKKAVLLDVPGYGYAKRSKDEVEKWNRLLGSYLEGRPDMKFLVLVVDCRRKCEDEERWFINRIPPGKLIIAATKTDKLKKNEQRELERRLVKEFKAKPGNIYPLSLLPPAAGIEPLREKLFSP